MENREFEEELEEKPSLPIRILRLVLTLLLSLAVICCVADFSLWSILNLGVPGSRTQTSGGNIAVMDSYDMYMTNQISDALDGVLSVDKVYWLNEWDLIAPEPNQACFGSTTDPADMEAVLAEATRLLGITEFQFSTDVTFLPGSEIQWYLDETIFAVTWQELLDLGIYTFSEVKIAHPSQFRRFLADGTYGSDKQYFTTSMARDVNAVVASSGDFYKYRWHGVVVYNGTVHRSNGYIVDTCFIDDKGDLIMVEQGTFTDMEETQKFVDENNIRFSVCFGPILIQDGVRYDRGHYGLGEITCYYPRAALCQLGELHYMVVTANSTDTYPRLPSLYTFGDHLLARGITTAYTLDGGQTGVIAMNGVMINPVQYDYQRAISDIIYFATALPDGD